jgi:hypothetical protein
LPPPPPPPRARASTTATWPVASLADVRVIDAALGGRRAGDHLVSGQDGEVRALLLALRDKFLAILHEAVAINLFEVQ